MFLLSVDKILVFFFIVLKLFEKILKDIGKLVIFFNIFFVKVL